MRPRIAVATLSETRPAFRARRQHLVEEEMAALRWLHDAGDVLESPPLTGPDQVRTFADAAHRFGAQALVVHIPVWTDPALTVRLTTLLPLPVLLVGNDRPETSSMVGVLGAGGALDQVGRRHERVIGHGTAPARRRIVAFARAAAARGLLRGQTLGLFGGRSLGIATATADPAEVTRVFGVDVEHVDQMAIVDAARAVPPAEASRHLEWLTARVGRVEYGGLFTPEALERQVRSYLATRQLAEARGFDFVAVKCQPELSDGYASQCVAHALCNTGLDADGPRPVTVHACEADIDGALTMQILHLLSGGSPAALLDVRWLDPASGVWTLANCGALPPAFAASDHDETGLSSVHLVPHVFGEAGGGALPMVARPQRVTLARLCRREGRYWMAIVAGEVVRRGREALAATTAAFPQAFVRSGAGAEFLDVFGSNHIHMVSGDYVEEIQAFCRLVDIPWQLWA